MKVNKIWQKDRNSFCLEWDDGEVDTYRLSDLQKRCPCASCSEGMSPPVDEEVQCTEVRSVGRYGLRIRFTSGCTNGIFSFDFLREFRAKELQ